MGKRHIFHQKKWMNPNAKEKNNINEGRCKHKSTKIFYFERIRAKNRDEVGDRERQLTQWMCMCEKGRERAQNVYMWYRLDWIERLTPNCLYMDASWMYRYCRVGQAQVVYLAVDKSGSLWVYVGVGCISCCLCSDDGERVIKAQRGVLHRLEYRVGHVWCRIKFFLLPTRSMVCDRSVYSIWHRTCLCTIHSRPSFFIVIPYLFVATTFVVDCAIWLHRAVRPQYSFDSVN